MSSSKDSSAARARGSRRLPVLRSCIPPKPKAAQKRIRTSGSWLAATRAGVACFHASTRGDLDLKRYRGTFRGWHSGTLAMGRAFDARGFVRASRSFAARAGASVIQRCAVARSCSSRYSDGTWGTGGWRRHPWCSGCRCRTKARRRCCRKKFRGRLVPAWQLS